MNIGASIVIKGSITSGEDLVISGRVEGEVRLQAGALVLAPGSRVVGDITVPSVVAHGEVDGSLTATALVHIRPTASVSGSIAAPRLIVAEGAQLNCRVEMPALVRPHVVQPATARLPVAV